MSAPGPRTALLLVDLQHDFLERPGLVPSADALCARAAALLAAARRQSIPVAHAHTLIGADGADAMPHWRRLGRLACVEGTRGALAPPSLAPADGELVLRKRFFSAFADPRLEPWLRQHRVQRLLVAGVYLHGCVRSTALDAYERGYAVAVADDAVGSTEPLHAELTRAWLGERAATFARTDALLAELAPAAAPDAAATRLPAAVIDARPRPAGPAHASVRHRNPCRTAEVLAEVPLAGAPEIAAAAASCAAAQADWAHVAPAVRADLLERWADDLAAQRERLTALVVREVGKPRRAAAEEVERAVAHARVAAEVTRATADASRLAAGVAARQRPLGVVGVITPWNNPLAIPVGKLAPALGLGNAVVLKPAPQASATALALLESLHRVGLAAGLVNVVLGNGATARALCGESRIAAVSVTGSIATGRVVAGLCALGMKPLQAELGGNNAAIVLADADLERAAHDLARAAFAFAGQRCTAIRRIVVEASVSTRFTELLRDAVAGLVNGEPDDPATEVGPLISVEKRAAVMAAIEQAMARGARRLIGGDVPPALAHGAWLAPALLAGVDPRDRIAQEETFAPLALILPAADLEAALAIANGVPHGLVMSVHTRDPRRRARVRDAAEAGILQLGGGPLAVHPRAPFSGWKASGIGPPEHGIWDAAFYSRAQAVYGDDPC
ncbi:aldehyde dehydrogenase family protein [bacterium]|nr:aldehyde dehydrogenase family protein [bacterium]